MAKKTDEELEKIKRAKLEELKRRVFEKPANPALDKPIEVTDATFKEITQTYSVVVIDCWAPWCGPCRMVAPIIEELAEDYAGRITFGKLNVDENPEVATQHGIMSIPTLLVFKNGQLADRIVGAMPRQTLEPKIVRYLE